MPRQPQPLLLQQSSLPSAADLGVDEEKLAEWRKLGGGDLEPVLASGAVALLDARWIIDFAECRVCGVALARCLASLNDGLTARQSEHELVVDPLTIPAASPSERRRVRVSQRSTSTASSHQPPPLHLHHRAARAGGHRFQGGGRTSLHAPPPP